MTAKKEYNYQYEDGKLMRATEANVHFTDELVTSKVVVNTVRYYYDTEGKLTKKVISPANGTSQTVYYENSDDNTVVKFTAGGRTITSHSKTDSFGRKVFDELQLGVGFVSRQFSYHSGDVTQEHKDNAKLKSSPTTNLVSQIVFSGGRTIAYEYDEEERITKVTDSIDGTTEYTYDALGQLVTETVNGAVVNVMTYDNYGNIKTKNGVEYVYDRTWKDLLIQVGDDTIEYDAQGNPLSYMGSLMEWEKGRQLKKLTKPDGTVITYTYNANGIRTSKTVDGIEHTYTLEGTKILREEWNGNTLIPLYDNEESVCGILYNDVPYYFLKNLQGDVIAITDVDGTVVANYTYDAWGKLTYVTGVALTIATINPFRYRGYYYDEETNLYYLQSRYYDAEVGRFINADEAGCIVRNTQSEKGNAYSYVFNCPTIKTDESGQFSLKFLAFGIQLAFSFGRINVGLELLWDLKNGKFYPFIYFGSGGSKDINGVMGYVSKCFLAPLKKTSRSVSAILKVLSKLSVAVSAIIVFGSSNRTMPGSYYGWFNCFSLTLKVFWANLIFSGAFAKNSNGYIASFGIGLSTDRPLFLKAGYGKAYYIHLNGWSNIKTQLSNLLAPLKSNAASKQKTLQTAAKLAG